MRAFVARGDGLEEVSGEAVPSEDPERLAAAWARTRHPGDPGLDEGVPALLRPPSFGTTIRVVIPPEVAGREVTLLELRWNRSAFELHDHAG